MGPGRLAAMAGQALTHLGIQRVASVVVVIACLARFVALEYSPPGFYVDEAMGATHILCLAEQGTGADGVSFPLFFRTASYSYPPFVHFSAGWVKVFGDSIYSLRAVAAFFNLLTLLGLYLVGRLFLDETGALLIALAGAVSPWAFQFARIAWDPAVAPCGAAISS